MAQTEVKILNLVEELMRRTGAKVNIPPNHANNETIIITGEREGVESAAEEINAIYQEKVIIISYLYDIS
jgi:hypothetical protein